MNVVKKEVKRNTKSRIKRKTQFKKRKKKSLKWLEKKLKMTIFGMNRKKISTSFAKEKIVEVKVLIAN